MKIFSVISTNSKTVKRLYVNQFVMAIFSVMVLFAAAKSNSLLFFASILCIGLYMFLTYNLMWETGARTAAKKMAVEPLMGKGIKEKLKPALILVLTGSIFNFIGASAYLAMKIYASATNITTNATDDMGIFAGNVIWTVMKFTNAVYMGIESLLFPNPNVGLPVEEAVIEFAPLLTPAYYYFLIMLPVIIVGVIAYVLGASEFSIMHKLGFQTKYYANTDVNYKINRK